MEKKYLGGFHILNTKATEVSELIKKRIGEATKTQLFFANTNFVVQCQALRDEFRHSPGVFILNDGVGLDIGAKLTSGSIFRENLAGTDFLISLLKGLGDSADIFLLGAKPCVAKKAAANLNSKFGLNVVGCLDGYEESKNIDEVLSQINQSRANVLLVALGNPIQEQWIMQYDAHLPDVMLASGVGAFLDFMAGEAVRAPKLVRKLRMEWFFRLMAEPRRLFKRYTYDILVFLKICFRENHRQINQNS